MTIVSRFAPSPTGLLHVGNARTAIVAWAAARAHGGRFVLRIDDTDVERGRTDYEAAIIEDLRWLGLDWDDFVRQSQRVASHVAAIERLKASGRLYPCYETPEELDLERRTLIARGKPPVYGRKALALRPEDRARLEGEGRRPHWRFLIDGTEVEWDDAVRGHVRFRAADLSDPVLVRADGRPLYHIGSVVDDIELGMTLVVRGEDHVANTAVHIQMFKALGADPPGFAHLPLLTDAEGGKLSKRLGSVTVKSLREELGVEPEAVLSLLSRLGTSRPIEPLASMEKVLDGFDLDQLGRAMPRFDTAELLRLNARILHEMPAETAAARLPQGVPPEFFLTVRGNLETLADAAVWWRIVREPIEPVRESPELLDAAARLLPAEPWDDTTWGTWTRAVAEATGGKGRALFHPLRLALTGREQGPELKMLLPWIGRESALARLQP